MKPVYIDFVPDLRWRWVWAVAFVATCAIILWSGWQWQQARELRGATQARLALAAQQTARTAEPQNSTGVDSREASKLAAARLLQKDINAAFATVENLREGGTRLRSLSLDTTGDLLRVEYELDTLARAASLTFALNAGYDTRVWSLESVSTPAGDAGQPGAFATGRPAGRAIWSARMNRL